MSKTEVRTLICDNCQHNYDPSTCNFICENFSEWHRGGHVPYDLLPPLPVDDIFVRFITDLMPCDDCPQQRDCCRICADYADYLKLGAMYEIETGREITLRYPTAY